MACRTDASPREFLVSPLSPQRPPPQCTAHAFWFQIKKKYMERSTHHNIMHTYTGSIYNNNNMLVHVFSISEEPGFSDPRRHNVYYNIHMRVQEIQWFTMIYGFPFARAFLCRRRDYTAGANTFWSRWYIYSYNVCSRYTKRRQKLYPITSNARKYNNNYRRQL